MNYSQLKAFHAVASEGGFTRAAEALRLTQPTLSGQVKALESRYNVRLFERRGRGIEITDLGRALFEVTQRYFATESEAEQLLASARGLSRGRLRIAADAPYYVVPLLARFHRRHPGVRLQLSFGNSEVVLEALLARRADVAVLPELAPDRRLYARAVREEEVAVFVDRGHAWARRRSVRLSELADQRLVLREPGSTTRRLIEQAMEAEHIVPREVLEVGSREAVREAVAAGLGVGVVFAGEFSHDPRLHLLTFRDLHLKATEYAVCLAERLDAPVVRGFFDLLAERSDLVTL